MSGSHQTNQQVVVFSIEKRRKKYSSQKYLKNSLKKNILKKGEGKLLFKNYYDGKIQKLIWKIIFKGDRNFVGERKILEILLTPTVNLGECYKIMY